ncbi:MAG: hypothetical protein ACD_46C00080G0015 [uncultured bacterium]|nr:MAG: hypothetical protein ACD_46C00080G0015 [uncultured bacterium]
MSFRIKQRGYFLLIAVIFIMIMGVLGSMIAYTFAGRATISVYQQQGLKTFYNAESGLEIVTRLLNIPALSGTPSRISCEQVTGNSSTTNASLNGGTFTVTTVNNSPISAEDTLSSAINSSTTSISVDNSAGFASSGRIMIDREAIDYAGISGNTFIGVVRGVGTTASSHASGAGVGQYQCSLDSQAGIPSIASPTYQRELQWDVQLQDGWAVGNQSGNFYTFTRWNGSTGNSWDDSSVPVGGANNRGNVNGISMLSYADGWAVGDSATNGFIFLHWDGKSWKKNLLAGSCSSQNLYSVSMVSSNEGWAVGARYRPGCGSSGDYRYTVLKYDGSAWSLLTPSTSPSIPADSSSVEDINSVHVIDTNASGTGDIGFAVGNSGQILKYDGSNWAADSSPVSSNLTGVYVVSSSEAWAVGASGAILKWNGSAWSSFSSPTSTQLNEVAMFDSTGSGTADFGIAVGDSGTIVSYNGSSWSATSSGSNNLYGIQIINSQDAWTVGASGTAIHWDGSSWTSVSSDTSIQLNMVGMIAPKGNPVSGWRQVFG